MSGQKGFGGIGFAVPSDTAVRYLDRMASGEEISHPWLGISGSDVTARVARDRRLSTQFGVLIGDTVSDSPARVAGLRAEDILTAINGQAVRTMDELGERLDRDYRPGDSLLIGILRGGQKLELPLTLAAWPEPQRLRR
jgi:S1-C subfamily serine protease